MTSDISPKKHKKKTQKMKPSVMGTRHLGGEIVRNYDLRFTNDDLSGNRKI